MSKTFLTTLSGAAAAAMLFVAPVAFAQSVNVGANVGVNAGSAVTVSTGANASVTTSANEKDTAQARLAAKMAAQISNMQNRATQEIDRRIEALQKLVARVGDMKKVSADEQTSLQTELQSQIGSLNSLAAKIAADTSTTTLKADVKSITDSYRIYMVVLPQNAILAAVDRINTLVGNMQTLGSKLQARITAAGSVSATVTAAMSDYTAKVADAQTQAKVAHDEVVNLKPDNGDKTVAASNTAALKDARAKLKAAQQDLIAARKDISTIVSNLPHGEAHATTTASTTVETH